MAIVLIIDDDKHIRYLLKEVLEILGHHIIEATNGKEALDAVQASSPALLIVDILMPEMDGIEMIRTIQASATNMKIIAISGGISIDDVDVLDVAKGLGATETLQKPFAISELIKIVKELLPPKPPHVPQS